MSDRVTTGMLSRIRELNAGGLNDSVIADELGLPRSTVNVWRRNMGLPARRTHREECRRKFELRLTSTGEVVARGTIRDCARAVHVTESYLYVSKSLDRKGVRQKYTFHEVGI